MPIYRDMFNMVEKFILYIITKCINLYMHNMYKHKHYQMYKYAADPYHNIKILQAL